MLISNLCKKYMPIKFNNFLNNYIVSTINSNVNYNLIFTLFIINIILLLYILFLNTYTSIELANNLDSYVNVYNYLKGK